MKQISRLIIVCSFLVMNLSGMSFAGEKLDKTALEKLIKGNTIEGKRVKWKTTYKIYFDPTGKFGRIDSLNNKDGGEWRVDKKGALCIIRNKEKCRTVKKRSDGGYDMYNSRGQLSWTIEKVSPANPYKIVPEY